ncbi:hypothetical protein ACFYKX_18765 [Cytobacillus sp. FJAT-54145]|uniref:Uncharacterized protein n=1 Tax=Cytobacillus spartinae TaxID=3299023 RepID=A0ABW6KEQ1_9BACI
MFKKIIKLMIGFFCGYFYIKWMPISFPFTLSDLIVEYVLNPIEFFAATMVFFIGFIVNAELIRGGVEQTVLLIHKKKIQLVEFLTASFVLLSFIILFYTAIWQTLAFFSFSLIYGIISVDFKKLKFVEATEK